MDKSKKLIIVIILLVVIIGGVSFYAFHQAKENKEMSELFAVEKLEMENEYTTFATQYDELQIQINNDSLREKLESEKLKTQRLLEELRQVKTSNAAEIMRLKKELKTVRAVLRTYVIQIDSLNKLNQALAEENQEVKQKWYQTKLFKILLIVVIVVISIIAPPAGAVATKAAMATGVFLGLSGTAALVAGFIVNYVAAAIVTNLIMKAATHVFGVKIGTIIGTIASIVTLQAGNAFLSGQSISASFSNMMSSVNLLKLTIPVGNAYANYLGSVTNDLQIQSQKLNDEFTSKSKEIEGKYKEMFGDGAMLFDPKLLTEHNAVLGESPSAFLERTLMTGTDIVDMSLDLLHNFVDITLSTELK